MILKKEKITEKVKKIVARYDDKKFELYEDFDFASRRRGSIYLSIYQYGQNNR